MVFKCSCLLKRVSCSHVMEGIMASLLSGFVFVSVVYKTLKVEIVCKNACDCLGLHSLVCDQVWSSVDYPNSSAAHMKDSLM